MRCSDCGALDETTHLHVCVRGPSPESLVTLHETEARCEMCALNCLASQRGKQVFAMRSGAALRAREKVRALTEEIVGPRVEHVDG